MKISIVCSSRDHPVYSWLERWKNRQTSAHDVELVERASSLSGGDILFLISCAEIVRSETRSLYAVALVVHASDLPRGRGWSPHVWQILEGRNEITVSLLEAEDKVDTGAIWAQRVIRFEGHELFDEINERLFTAELELMDFALDNFGGVQPQVQLPGGDAPYRRRSPEDSRIDPHQSIADQFDLLRVADPVRYAAFFDFRGYRYEIGLIKRGKVET